MGAGLYVHVPLCRTKCPYCDFFSVTDELDADDFVDAVLDEARTRSPAWHVHRFDSLYVGGGTPSLLPPAALRRLLRGLREETQLGWEPDVEVTVEANPDDLRHGWADEARAAGVGRLSLGVQSFDDAELRFLGRRHDAEQARRAITAARRAGFDNLGLDLIYGLPKQSIEAWTETLREALGHRPEHLSCYQLTVEPSTPLARRRPQLPDEELAGALFERTAEVLEAAGYEHYEVSNFARAPTLRSRHNQKYWRHAPYLGLGPKAHSFDGHRRSWNERRARGWSEGGSEVLDDGQRTLEALMLGFRTADGVALETLRELPHGAEDLEALVRQGLVRVDGQRARPTRAGMLLADGLPLRFRM